MIETGTPTYAATDDAKGSEGTELTCSAPRQKDKGSDIYTATSGVCRNAAGNIAPYCTDGCGSNRPCDKVCRDTDESCITCGDYGYCEGMTGGGGGGGVDDTPGKGDATISGSANSMTVDAWGRADNPEDLVQISIEYRNADTNEVLLTRSTSGRADGRVSLTDTQGIGPGGEVTSQSWGFLSYLIGVVVMVAGAVVVSKLFKSGTSSACFANPQYSESNGEQRCTYTKVCNDYGPSCLSGTTITRPANGYFTCAPHLRQSYRWAALAQVGDTYVNSSCFGATYSYPSAGCACKKP